MRDRGFSPPEQRRRWLVRLSPVVGALALVAVALGCGRDQPKQVIFILMDALRADRLSSYGYERSTTPSLDALGAGGVVFRNHFTQGRATRDSMPKLFYSRYFAPPLFPRTQAVPLWWPQELFWGLDDRAVSLPRVLSGNGLFSIAFSAHAWMKPDSAFGKEFDEFHYLYDELEFPKRYAAPRAAQVVDSAIDWIGKNTREDFFLYLHFLDTHTPHLYEEEAQHFLSPERVEATDLSVFTSAGTPKPGVKDLDGDQRIYLDAIYDGSLRYADDNLGRLFGFLKANGLWEHALIVVTADHGEALMETPGRFGHSGDWVDSVAHIPLLLHHPPKLEPRVVDALTESVDVMPTILELLQLELPAGKTADGRDLGEVLRDAGAAKTQVFSDFGLRTRTHKALLMRNAASRTALFQLAEEEELESWEGELYDLTTDPLEREDIWHAEPERAAEMLQEYRRAMTPYYRRFAAAAGKSVPVGAFAIGASSFSFGSQRGAVRDVRLGAPPQELAADSWIRQVDWSRFFLFGGAGAEPLEIGFPLPNGRYRVSATVRGSASFGLPGREPILVAGRALGQTRFLVEQRVPRGDEIELGEVEVEAERFTMTVVPDAPFLIRSIGFVPEASVEETPEERAAYQERLRALGYLN